MNEPGSIQPRRHCTCVGQSCIKAGDGVAGKNSPTGQPRWGSSCVPLAHQTSAWWGWEAVVRGPHLWPLGPPSHKHLEPHYKVFINTDVHPLKPKQLGRKSALWKFGLIIRALTTVLCRAKNTCSGSGHTSGLKFWPFQLPAIITWARYS